MASSFGYDVKRRPASFVAQRQSSTALRDSATASLAVIPLGTEVSGPAASSTCADLAETAEAILEGIYSDTEQPLSPVVLATATQSVQSRPQESQGLGCSNSATHPEPQGERAEARDELPTPRIRAACKKRRTHAADANVDHEFLEKKWRHERELKDKKAEVKLQRIALHRAQLDAKERRSEKIYELKRLRLEKEFELRERELQLRSEELQRKDEQNRLLNTNQQALLSVLRALTTKV
ncbi:hypothetical protein ISCGN_004066 [Ixodes scapularis]